jgi:hypothetical protein
MTVIFGASIIKLPPISPDPYFPNMASKLPSAEMEHVKRLREDASSLYTLFTKDADPNEIAAVLRRMAGDTTYLQQYVERRTPPPTPRTSNSSSEGQHQAAGRREEFVPSVASKEQFMKTFDLSEQDYQDVAVTILLEPNLISRKLRPK